MRITKEENLFQLSFLPRIFPVNCYLVEEEKELTLIDAALSYSANSILQAAQRLGKPITRIALTHAHGDHVGALDSLRAALPQAKVYMSRRDAKLLAGNFEFEAGEPNTPIKGSFAKSLTTKPDVYLEDGDRVGSLQAVAAPGHTPGMMAFLDVRSRALIAGDALVTRGGVAVSGTFKLFFPFPAFATWHKKTALETAKKLKQLSPALLAVGHGRMLRNPVEALGRAIEEAEKAES
ncbi:MBL fold metallo-hydrolase [Paenibacillus eucommiae]|uniref:Glyoxylase-like metal-dependent hydrolase (Beta-lactamase superfamily II) n=1 Tax=Paenibacillus eucommiae TaxID=1355755 RepID=A0ABS4ISD1_9BACL|nr:MBL fold metallo-hydrolase [Paenibacillus eucommiae]MBP1990482.1 glyoxylase-like metal-dependent hydrolase (beta-lactamase superfamily II) [Paenibacillus eucommiae]